MMLKTPRPITPGKVIYWNLQWEVPQGRCYFTYHGEENCPLRFHLCCKLDLLKYTVPEVEMHHWKRRKCRLHGAPCAIIQVMLCIHPDVSAKVSSLLKHMRTQVNALSTLTPGIRDLINQLLGLEESRGSWWKSSVILGIIVFICVFSCMCSIVVVASALNVGWYLPKVSLHAIEISYRPLSAHCGRVERDCKCWSWGVEHWRRSLRGGCDHQLPMNWNLAMKTPHFPVFGICIPLVFHTPRSCPKDITLRWWCLLRPSGCDWTQLRPLFKLLRFGQRV